MRFFFLPFPVSSTTLYEDGDNIVVKNFLGLNIVRPKNDGYTEIYETNCEPVLKTELTGYLFFHLMVLQIYECGQQRFLVERDSPDEKPSYFSPCAGSNSKGTCFFVAKNNRRYLILDNNLFLCRFLKKTEYFCDGDLYDIIIVLIPQKKSGFLQTEITMVMDRITYSLEFEERAMGFVICEVGLKSCEALLFTGAYSSCEFTGLSTYEMVCKNLNIAIQQREDFYSACALVENRPMCVFVTSFADEVSLVDLSSTSDHVSICTELPDINYFHCGNFILYLRPLGRTSEVEDFTSLEDFVTYGSYFVGQISDQRVHLHMRGDLEILNFEAWPEMGDRVLKHTNGLVLDKNSVCLRVFSEEPENMYLYFDRSWNVFLKDSKGSTKCKQIIPRIYKCPGHDDFQFYTPKDEYWAIQQAVFYEEKQSSDEEDWLEKENEWLEREGKRGLPINTALVKRVRRETIASRGNQNIITNHLWTSHFNNLDQDEVEEDLRRRNRIFQNFVDEFAGYIFHAKEKALFRSFMKDHEFESDGFPDSVEIFGEFVEFLSTCFSLDSLSFSACLIRTQIEKEIKKQKPEPLFLLLHDLRFISISEDVDSTRFTQELISNFKSFEIRLNFSEIVAENTELYLDWRRSFYGNNIQQSLRARLFEITKNGSPFHVKRREEFVYELGKPKNSGYSKKTLKDFDFGKSQKFYDFLLRNSNEILKRLKDVHISHLDLQSIDTALWEITRVFYFESIPSPGFETPPLESEMLKEIILDSTMSEDTQNPSGYLQIYSSIGRRLMKKTFNETFSNKKNRELYNIHVSAKNYDFGEEKVQKEFEIFVDANFENFPGFTENLKKDWESMVTYVYNLMVKNIENLLSNANFRTACETSRASEIKNDQIKRLVQEHKLHHVLEEDIKTLLPSLIPDPTVELSDEDLLKLMEETSLVEERHLKECHESKRFACNDNNVPKLDLPYGYPVPIPSFPRFQDWRLEVRAIKKHLFYENEKGPEILKLSSLESKFCQLEDRSEVLVSRAMFALPCHQLEFEGPHFEDYMAVELDLAHSSRERYWQQLDKQLFLFDEIENMTE